MARYAILRDTRIENICDWDGNTETWTPPEGSQPVLAEDHWQLGGSIVDGVYSDPPPPPPPERVTLTHWLSTLHTRTQRIAWNRAREMARLLAVGSPDLDGESEETLTALETVGEWFMVVSLTGEVTLADDAIYDAGTTLGVYADPTEVTRIKANEAP